MTNHLRVGAQERDVIRTINDQLNYQLNTDSKTPINLFNIIPSSQHSAILDGTTDYDASTDIKKALLEANQGGDYFTEIHAPAGLYLCHEVDVSPGKSKIIGKGGGATEFRYNGNGGLGSSVFIDSTSTPGGSTPWGGFESCRIDGYDGSSNVAEHCFVRTGTSGFDFFYNFKNVHVRQCFGDAIDFGPATAADLVNLHLEELRIDAVGGYGIKLTAKSTVEGRPISLKKVSVDTNGYEVSGFIERMQELGYYNGTNWCKGLMHVVEGYGLRMRLTDIRFECNRNIIDSVTGKKCLIYWDQTSQGNLPHLQLDNFTGFGRYNDGIVVVYDPNNTLNLSGSGFEFPQGVLYECGDLSKNISTQKVPGYFSRATNTQFSIGNFNNTQQHELRSATDQTQYHPYKLDDEIDRISPTAGQNRKWRVTSPTTGCAYPHVFSITTLAACTATDNDIDISGEPNQLWLMPVGLNITLIGAGVSGADLGVYITGVKADEEKITVSVAPSTTVATLTIKSLAATFDPFLYVGYRTGSGTPTITPYRVLDKYVDTTNDVLYQSTGLTSADWVAVSSDFGTGSGDPSGVTTPHYTGWSYLDTTNDLWYRAHGPTSTDWQMTGHDYSYRTNAGDPDSVVTPLRIGEELLDTTNDLWYKAYDTSSTDWQQMGHDYSYRSGSSTPVGSVTPLYIGEEYLETTTPAWYKATGATSTDWQAL